MADPANTPRYKLASTLSAQKGEEVSYTTGLFTPSFTPTAIAATVAGVVNGKLLLDSEDQLYPVVVGINPYRFKSITESGTTATGLFVLQG